ncbi:hypothetical protein FZO89_12815 [Luteimonas viscosa]|uniref:Uncharacterized protein n=1 Tax=Luteimonas viscosa TaxID=1132694 RepID=A0A5D4XQU1_9GAMM|nr:hypothetical protein [Luteimonas viscosa]TYT27068.1 hypothetical protein FZO89_12815 [Luteimonas viscosa]
MIRKHAPAALAAFVVLLAATPAAARSLVRIDVVDRDSGRWLPEYRHRHESWIAGTPGHRYGVRLTNNTGERVLVVLSVDGVNAVTGQTAHPSQTGYVLAPWQSTEITGWRKSYQDVAGFVFTALPDSYAARTGRPDDVGTIGVAVFRERADRHQHPYPPPSPPIAHGADAGKSRRAAPATKAEQSADAYHADDGLARQQIGTGHGRREWSPVGQTSFARASARPAQLTQLRYDAPQALAARGIVPSPAPPAWHRERPRAFPGRFVADPPGHWR